MWGFLAGSIGLVALEVLVQPNAQGAVQAGGSFISNFAQRLLSPQVAGLPDFTLRGVNATPSTTPPPSSGTTQQPNVRSV